MLFANPVFLAALSALAIPVIIHLYNFRRYKKVYFTNVRFIAEIRQESKKRSQLKHLLILLMRLLAISALLIAFAQPYLPSRLMQKNIADRKAVSIYIDNSFSMEALATNGKLLDIAKTRAIEIASAYKPSDLFQLLTADFEGRHQRFVSSDEFRTLVEEVTISPAFRNLPEVLKRQDELLLKKRGTDPSAYIISDFQRSSTNLGRLKTDSSVAYFFVPVSAEKTNNLYIDSTWFDAPSHQAGQAVRMNIRITNSSPEMLEKIPVRLAINKTQKAVSSFSIDPWTSTVVTVPFTNNDQGIQNGTLEITDYPITWDDKFLISYTIKATIPVLCINEDKSNHFLDALFENDSAVFFKNVSVNRLDYSSFPRFPLIILNGIEELSSGLQVELLKFIRQGGDLLLFPGKKINILSYASFLGSMGLSSFSGVDTSRQSVSALNIHGEIFRDVFEKDASGRIVLPDNVDMPVVYKHYTIKETTTSGYEDILKLQGGQHFLCDTKVEKGRIYICSVPLDDSWSNFPKHTVFVPSIYRIALLSEASPPLYYFAGSDDPIEILNDSVPVKEVYKIRKVDSYNEFIPEMRSAGGNLLLFPHNQVRESGHYYIAEGSQVLQGIAFNYNRRESEMSFYTAADLQDALKQAGIKYFSVIQAKKSPLTKQIIEMSQGTPLWKIFIILTLLFIAAEIALVRLMKD